MNLMGAIMILKVENLLLNNFLINKNRKNEKPYKNKFTD